MEAVHFWWMMDKLVISKVNDVFIRIECDTGVRQELADYFTFYVPGYKFMPAFKNKMWDGKIRLYDLRSLTLYVGLLDYVKKFAEERDYVVEQNFNGHIAKINEEDVKLFRQKILNVPFEPHEYQYTAVTHALRNKRALLLSPTSSGKSFIIYILTRFFFEAIKGKRMLLIVPTTSLVEQMRSDFLSYAQNDDGFDESMIHTIYSGKEKDTLAPIVITTWQSIYKMPKQWFEPFRMVVGDEAHTFQAKSLSSIMEKLTDCPYRFGLTGTLDGTLTHKLVLEGLFGPVYQVTTTKALMDNDQIAKLDIKCLVLKYSDEECKQVKGKTYAEEIDFIVSHTKRNNFVRNLALSQKGNTLVLFNLVEKHGKPLFRMIQEKAAEGRKIFYVSGETAVDDREAIRAITEKEKDAIIVASLGTFSTGINIRNLHNVIFASPSKSQIKVLQSIGRGLRKSDDGRDTTLYDICDDLHWKTNKNFTLQHAGIRVQIYTKEQFNYKIHEIQLT
jgi:superfamily II DNA or RNA helicase